MPGLGHARARARSARGEGKVIILGETKTRTGVINIWGSRKYGDPPFPNSREFGDPFVNLGILCDRVRQRT